MQRNTEDGYQRTDRELTREPRSKSWYCFGCDGNLVSAGHKCERCKTRMAGKRNKLGKPVVRD